MDNNLTLLLKEVLVLFNKEARILPPSLESEMCLALDKLGGEWLLTALQVQGIDSAGDISQNPDPYWKLLKEEKGREKLRKTTEANRKAILELRRKMVSLLRVFKQESQSIKFNIQELPNDSGIYGMLYHRQKGE